MDAALGGEEVDHFDWPASDLPDSEEAGLPIFNAPVAGPVAQYKHDHPPARNAHALYREKLRLGHRVAERVTAVVV